ncbi:hypothetical protein [Paenibacillus sp. GCM10027626]|uniref:hypothetical protein n=1 Tax=Paenibacillus sp. GCM10027626 TaxID=3273411 RepID=UPI00362F570D
METSCKYLSTVAVIEFLALNERTQEYGPVLSDEEVRGRSKAVERLVGRLNYEAMNHY